ncbi:ACT domain-containing protein [Ferruginibacter sp. SUN106]|uniref:ACT domain-containing protein n=1 Tax=Ferruginibacter sp. SUN106 TaxID=2978348 RepID=UPI003D36E81B
MDSVIYSYFYYTTDIRCTMTGENDLSRLLKTMQPQLNDGEFVFCTTPDLTNINMADVVMLFKEQEGYTLLLTKATADQLPLPYSFIASWITLTVHSSLEAVGLTAAFSNALAAEGISCNVVAAFYHDHIFVDKKDAQRAIVALQKLSKTA